MHHPTREWQLRRCIAFGGVTCYSTLSHAEQVAASHPVEVTLVKNTLRRRRIVQFSVESMTTPIRHVEEGSAAAGATSGTFPNVS